MHCGEFIDVLLTTQRGSCYLAVLPLLCSALIFAHRAFAFREILALLAADIILLPFVLFGLLIRPTDTTALALPFRAAMVPLITDSCRCNFPSSVCKSFQDVHGASQALLDTQGRYRMLLASLSVVDRLSTPNSWLCTHRT